MYVPGHDAVADQLSHKIKAIFKRRNMTEVSSLSRVYRRVGGSEIFLICWHRDY